MGRKKEDREGTQVHALIIIHVRVHDNLNKSFASYNLGSSWDSNPGLSDYRSDTLTTEQLDLWYTYMYIHVIE